MQKFLFFLLFLPVVSFSQASKVKLFYQNSQWDLLVNDKVFYINGGGGTVKMKELKEAGGNTIRTWGLKMHRQF